MKEGDSRCRGPDSSCCPQAVQILPRRLAFSVRLLSRGDEDLSSSTHQPEVGRYALLLNKFLNIYIYIYIY